MNGRDVVRLVLLSAPRRPIVTKHAHRTSGVPLPVNCSCVTRKQLRGPLLSVKNASPCADLELATHSAGSENRAVPSAGSAFRELQAAALARNRRRVSQSSEKKLECELYLPARRRRGQLARVGRIERPAQPAKVGMIRQIEGLGPKLQPLVLSNLEILED